MKLNSVCTAAGFLLLISICFDLKSIHVWAATENEWAAEIPGGMRHAKRVAVEMGYRVKRAMRRFEDVYILEADPHSKTKRNLDSRELTDHTQIKWADEQTAKQRVKRDASTFRTDPMFNDPEWSKQWYLHDTRKNIITEVKRDLHVLPVWRKGFTGKGVVVTILDDGLEWNHTDIHQNYDRNASYDLNNNREDPFPRYDVTNENKHGTRCAAEVAMAANNNNCGVGVAYNAGIGGIKMLDGKITDSLEGEALSHNLQHIDIFSASWGPTDDGTTLEGPGRMAYKAIREGITDGRGGKGTIYVWASGNGGYKGDDCACDGYTASRYTIGISSASEHEQSPWYAESCPSTMGTAFSSGRSSKNDRSVVAADLHNLCTAAHSGTSAAAPLAAGIFALVLEANPSLTWRDLQHLVVLTSESAPLLHNKGWKTNGRGFNVSNKFGFGLLNAASLVEHAQNWTTVPKYLVCSTSSQIDVDKKRATSKVSQTKWSHTNNTDMSVAIESGKISTATITVDDSNCGNLNYIEHVELVTTVSYPSRGELSIYLTSPQGTKTQLLGYRRNDVAKTGIKSWPFMSVHTWGEDPRGEWTIEIVTKSKQVFRSSRGVQKRGSIENLELKIYGTKEAPAHYKFVQSQPRKKAKANYNNVKNEREVRRLTEEADYLSKLFDRRSPSQIHQEQRNSRLLQENLSGIEEEDEEEMMRREFEQWLRQ